MVTGRYDGVEAADLARRLGAPACVALETVASTLDVVHDLAAGGATAGTIVLADEQVAGRGRQGRRWHSPRGAGIWLGYLVRPARRLEGGVLGLRVGLAVVRALEQLGIAPQLKWPNDVMLHDRKLAGVLCEVRGESGAPGWVAVGIGINMHGPLPPELTAGAIALDEVLPDVTRVTVLERLVAWLHQLSTHPELSEEERRTYEAYAWLTGRRVVRPVCGVARGVAADGALLVGTAAGVERVVGGSVATA